METENYAVDERYYLRTRRGVDIMKRHDSCNTCAFLDFSLSLGGGFFGNYYCNINHEEIESPKKMGGREKCPCYTTKAEYKKAEKERERERKKRSIEDFDYPQKSKLKYKMK